MRQMDHKNRTVVSLPASPLVAAFFWALFCASGDASAQPTRLESVGVPLERHMTPSTNFWREGNLLYGEAVEGGTEQGPFYVYDLTTRTVKYRGNADIHTGFRNIAVDARGNAYFSVNGTGLARYDPRTNAVTVLPARFPAGSLRASTTEAASGWMYMATTDPARLYRFRPSTGSLEDLGILPGYTAHLELDPAERHVYYMPYAHGGAFRQGAPVLRFDVETREHKVIASLNEEIEGRYRYRVGGAYALDIDRQGEHLYLSLNAVNLERDPRATSGFGDPVLVVLEIPPTATQGATAPAGATGVRPAAGSAAGSGSPIVHFTPFPLPTYAGNPWSTWGGAHVASNGLFYAAIGDHLTTNGNSYLFEYDPGTRALRMVGSALAAVSHVTGDYGHGKIHSQISESRDGYLYMTTFRGSPGGIVFTNAFRGGVILRYPVGSTARGQ